jgi:hypothetical protein
MHLKDNSVVATTYSGGRNAVFEELRRRLFAIAYRMMGTKADAEDIVQEAYVRWHQADVEAAGIVHTELIFAKGTLFTHTDGSRSD